MHGASTATAEMMVCRFMKEAIRLTPILVQGIDKKIQLTTHHMVETNMFTAEDAVPRIMTLRKAVALKGGGAKSRRQRRDGVTSQFCGPYSP